MATIDVRDATGNAVAVEKPLAPGRAGASLSRPVVLATEDKTALDLVSTKLDTIIGHIDGIEGFIDGLETQAEKTDLIISSIRKDGTFTDRSTTITTGGTTQALYTANSSRRRAVIFNVNSTTDLWFSPIGAAAADTNGSFRLAPLQSVELEGAEAERELSIVSTLTGHKITAYEVVSS
jgi:hypothetical protein